MVDLPDLSPGEVSDTIRRTIPWLPEPFRCPGCGAPCREAHAYDPQTAAFYAESNGQRPVWRCDDCGSAWRRDGERGGLTFDIWGRNRE